MSQDVETRSSKSARSLSVRIPSTNTPDESHQVAPLTDEAVPLAAHVLAPQNNSLRLPKIEQAAVAARKIETAWLGMRDRQLFKLLKHAVCAAEASLSLEILRKVCPKEAELLKDKTMTSKVRLRFGGSEFPPHIYFKIFLASDKGITVHYVSGKKMIEPASEAARDACQLMGHRLFYDQLITDQLSRGTHVVTDEVDIITLKDYMQYLSLLDETPAYMGGRDNGWRKLTLEVLPRQTIFYDIVQYLYTHKMTPQLLDELPALLALPLNEDVQLNQIRIISQLRPVTSMSYKQYTRPLSSPGGKKSSRWSRKATRMRAMKMRRLYETETATASGDSAGSRQRSREETRETQREDQAGEKVEDTPRESVGDEEEEWESEANKLYEWTQELSLDELVATPRLSVMSLTTSH